MENQVDKKVAEQTGSATKKQNIKKCVEQKKGDNKTSVTYLFQKSVILITDTTITSINTIYIIYHNWEIVNSKLAKRRIFVTIIQQSM